jgi:hypothetical protein
MSFTLSQIKARIDELAQRVGASASLMPTYGFSVDSARPHIEVDDAGLHFVVVERGQELQRVTSTDLDEILWCVFQGVTHSLAFDYELHHRIGSQDCRRIAFAKQIELLELLSPQWAQRRRLDLDAILRRSPFVDR